MSKTIMYGRDLSFQVAPFNGTFVDGTTGSPPVSALIALCVAMFPDVSVVRNEVEVTDSCSPDSAVERIAGLSDGAEVVFEAYYKGSDATDWGIGASTLYTLAVAGATVGIKDVSNQSALSANLVLRYDVVLLEATYMGGAMGDAQKIRVRGRITGTVDAAAT